MSLAELKKEVDFLLGQLNNLKKSPNRQRNQKSANKKLDEIQQNCDRINKLCENLRKKQLNKAEEEYIQGLREKAKEYKEKAIKIIITNIKDKDSDNEESDENSEQKENTRNIEMSEFDYNTAQKLPMLSIDREDKRTEAIRDFVNNVEFYHDTLTNQGKTTLISFITKCKIQGKTLTELGNLRPTTLVELKRDLLTKCGPKDTIETVQTKLNMIRQGQRSMREYINDIENLTTKMTNLEVSSQTEDARPALQLANERRGLSFLKKGVNDKYKIVLDCARHTTFQAAAQHLLELEPTMSSQTNEIRYMGVQTDTNRYGYNNRKNYNTGTSNYNANYNRSANNIGSRYGHNSNSKTNNFNRYNNNYQRNTYQPQQFNRNLNNRNLNFNKRNYTGIQSTQRNYNNNQNNNNMGNSYNKNNNYNRNNIQNRRLLAITEVGNDGPTEGEAGPSGGKQ